MGDTTMTIDQIYAEYTPDLLDLRWQSNLIVGLR